MVLGGVLDEASFSTGLNIIMKFLSDVLHHEVFHKVPDNAYDEAFHKISDDSTHRQDARSWCLALSSMRSPSHRVRQDA